MYRSLKYIGKMWHEKVTDMTTTNYYPSPPKTPYVWQALAVSIYHFRLKYRYVYVHGYMQDTNQLGVDDQQALEILGFENKFIPHKSIDKHNHGSI